MTDNNNNLNEEQLTKVAGGAKKKVAEQCSYYSHISMYSSCPYIGSKGKCVQCKICPLNK